MKEIVYDHVDTIYEIHDSFEVIKKYCLCHGHHETYKILTEIEKEINRELVEQLNLLNQSACVE